MLLCLPFVPYLLQIADELGFLGDCGEAVMVLLVGWFFASAVRTKLCTLTSLDL